MDGRIEITIDSSTEHVKGYTSIDHDSDRARLLEVAKAHTAMFEEQANRTGGECAGFVERLDVVPQTESTSGDTLYVRADLHSDLASLLAQLAMHQLRGERGFGAARCFGTDV
jgi:hypothetical protein